MDSPPITSTGLRKSYNTLSLAMRNRQQTTQLQWLLQQLHLEHEYVRKSISIDMRLTRARYKRYIPPTADEIEAENTELLFRSIRQVKIQ